MILYEISLNISKYHDIVRSCRGIQILPMKAGNCNFGLRDSVLDFGTQEAWCHFFFSMYQLHLKQSNYLPGMLLSPNASDLIDEI